MNWNVLVAALLAATPAKPPLPVSGCDLLANPVRFEGKMVQFAAYRVPALEYLAYAPFGCDGAILIFGKPVIMRDHRLPLEGAYQSRSGFMVPATRIEGRVRVERAPAVPGGAAVAMMTIENAVIQPAGYRRAGATATQR